MTTFTPKQRAGIYREAAERKFGGNSYYGCYAICAVIKVPYEKIHQELDSLFPEFFIYRNNVPTQLINRWMEEWDSSAEDDRAMRVMALLFSAEMAENPVYSDKN